MNPAGHSPAANRPRRTLRLGAVVLAAATWLAVATSASPVSAQQSGAAEALFRQAVGLAKKGQYEKAIPKFEASYELDPARGTLLGWAMAEERAGKLASALAHYQQLRDAARAGGDERREQVATSRIKQLLPRVPTLVVTSVEPLPEGTKLTLNGRTLPGGALGTQLPLDPGDWALRVEAPDGGHFAQDLSLGEGARERVAIELVPGETQPDRPPEPEPDRPPQVVVEPSSWTPLRTTGVVFGVVGLAGLGVGSYLWVESGSKFDELNETCPDNVCSPDQRAAVDDGRSQENLARVALILGGVALTTGVTLFVLGAPSDPEESEGAATVSLRLAPGSVGVHGHF